MIPVFAAALAGCSAENGPGQNGGPVGSAGSDAEDPPADGGSAGSYSWTGFDASQAGSGGWQAGADASQAESGGSRRDAGYAPPIDGSLNECATITREAEQVEIITQETVTVTVSEPIAMYLMLDMSGSMSGDKWQMAVYAINKFIGATISENINIALQYFPITSGGCDGSGYDQPAVALGRLPDHANAITRSLANTSPTGGTPTEGALRGMTSFCAQYKQDATRNPEGEDCVGVLITDGAPTSCVTDTASLALIAGDAFTDDQVMTFTVGMTGANFTVLDQIAQAGGTDCDLADPLGFACDVSGGTGDDLLAVLELIRDTITETRTEERVEYQSEVLECEWQIPDPPIDEVFDRERVNVRLWDDDKGEIMLGQVPSADKCGDEAGWYYDDPDDPITILACPETCEIIQVATGARIDIVLGCQTIVLLE